jgi:hypothetical protein
LLIFLLKLQHPASIPAPTATGYCAVYSIWPTEAQYLLVRGHVGNSVRLTGTLAIVLVQLLLVAKVF